MSTGKISSCFLGAGAGVLMAMVLLYGCIQNSFAIGNAMFAVICVIAAFFPMCAGLAGNYGFDEALVKVSMILTSLGICFLYARAVNMGDNYNTGNSILMIMPLILHGVASVGAMAGWFIRRNKQG